MECFICGLYGFNGKSYPGDFQTIDIIFRCECERCGNYVVNGTNKNTLEQLPANKKARLSQIVRRQWENEEINQYVDVNKDKLENLAEITPTEIADNILVCFAKKIPKAWGDFIFIEIRDGTPDNYRKNKENINASDYAHIGLLPNPNKFALQSQILYFCEYLEKQEFLKKTLLFSVNDMKYSYYIQIKPEGWARYDEIQKQTNTSKKAFLAKKFLKDKDLEDKDNKIIDTFWEKLAKSIKEQLDITLENPLETTPKAGLIDARMEKEIRDARFLIADLSHDNQGAYWEAGFAFGLGKKVVYIKQGNKADHHFDTSHHTTIFWEQGEEEVAIERIIATIKNSGIL